MQSCSLDDLPSDLRGAAVVIGNFDGVHRGHAWVMQVARDLGAPVVALTFEPHPRAVLFPQSAPFRLTPGAAKCEALAKAGADAVVTLRFDARLAAMSAADFVDEVIVRGLGASSVIVGEDYRFGRNREGDARLLAAMGERLGFHLVTASPAKNSWGERFSSSRIRDRIAAGDIVEVSRLLGRLWSISGRAAHGAGGDLRLDLGDHLRPSPGRYAVTLHPAGALPVAGVAIFREGSDEMTLPGADWPGADLAGALKVYLHQRLGAPDAEPGQAEGTTIGSHIFCAAE